MLHIPPRAEWEGQPVVVGDAFRLHRDRCGQPLEAACRLVTHQLGWELRLEIAGSVQLAQVCPTRDEVLATSDRWKSALLERGWH